MAEDRASGGTDDLPLDEGVLEDVSFNPALQALDLTKEEKLRATALMLAIKYHADTIVTDAPMYKALVKNQAHLEPSTVHKVVDIAMQFDDFLRGQGQAGLVAPGDQAAVDELEAATGEEASPRGSVP